MFFRGLLPLGRLILASLLLVAGCRAYDPSLARLQDSQPDAGWPQPDAGPFGDAAAFDAGSDAAAEDAGEADAAQHEFCRPNPDDASCSEVCRESCNGLDDDCDGNTDESPDADRSCAALHAESVCQSGSCLVTQCSAGYRDCDQNPLTGCEVRPDDSDNCGGCGHQCKIADASAVCLDGQCLVNSCSSGFADCDHDGVSCELRINTLTDCGACGQVCRDVPNAVPSCASGSCGVGSCKAGWGDCDGDAKTGCEQQLDRLQHCGGCGRLCSKASCGGGACTAADCSAMPGRADCDGDEASCEIDLQTDPNNCGACGYKCRFNEGVIAHATLGCSANSCTARCEPGFGDCDGNYANGCEQPLNTLSDCGACGGACSIANATASCGSGSCLVQSCNTDHADCDNDRASCETALNTANHCGACGRLCSLANAVEGCGGSPGNRSCTVASCEANWADCDTTSANGCERDVRTPANGGLGPCLPDSGCVKSTSGTHEYYVCPGARSWADARSRCQLQTRGELAQIADANEDTFVSGRIGGAVWAGHNDSAHEGLWVWSRNQQPFFQSGSGALAPQYSNFALGEPNDSGDCGALYMSGAFDDADCNGLLPFVCEVMPDECPSDPAKLDPGQCGCGTVDADADSDGFADCNDGCASDPGKHAQGACGCGTPDLDSDGDATFDCNDQCPNDPAKIAPGACNCGVSDADSDSDGTRDCDESCDNDPSKQSPGVCGCGQPDTDSDGDRTANCVDACPLDDSTILACFSFTHSNFSIANLNFTTSPNTTLNCGTTTINSSNANPFSNWCGTAPSFAIQAQNGGPELLVIPLKGLRLSSGATLRLLGSRPVVFAVRGDVVIDGTVDANASGSTPGAGGNWACGSSAGGAGSGSADFGAGGGGGGGGAFGTAGGRGGQGDSTNNYGTAGTARGIAAINPLYGGCPGGNGGGCSAVGGAGGGALQITASGNMDVNSTIRANGADGATGCSTEGGGAGGGSGGGILLESPTRDTSGSSITANGGRGGAGTGPFNGSGGGGSSTSGNGSQGGNANGAGGGGGGGYGRVKR